MDTDSPANGDHYSDAETPVPPAPSTVPSMPVRPPSFRVNRYGMGEITSVLI